MTPAEDELAIRQLAAAFTDAANCRSAEGMAAVFAEDGEMWAAGRDRAIKGHAKMADVIAIWPNKSAKTPSIVLGAAIK